MLVTAEEVKTNLQGGGVLQSTHTHGHTSVSQSAKTYIHKLCADTGCRQEDLTRATTYGVRESKEPKLVIFYKAMAS